MTITHLVCILCIITSLLAGCISDSSKAEPEHLVQILDQQLDLSLIAQTPDIVTPIGLAIDSKDHIFVLESHTHTPPDDYNGPTSDLIKVFTEQNGTLEFVSTFSDGITDGMNLAFGPDNNLYVVSSQSVIRYNDQDGDYQSDSKEVLLQMVAPEAVYDHAGLLGIAIRDEWIYISRGNTGSKYWEIRGTDGSTINGYGDGGNVIRCKLDGSDVEEVATGFWNPFDLTFTSNGRLLVVDNDPDSRGPNKLVEVIEGGDYGYKSLYGGSGLHPFLAWNGELPGTLPFVVGLGEAPTSILDTEYTMFSDSYENSLLISIWEESKIVRVTLNNKGILQGKVTDLVQGGHDFRPVAFAVNSTGAVYFSDWAERTYPNHGKGRIWKLENLATNENLTSRGANTSEVDDHSLDVRQQIRSARDLSDLGLLESALLSDDKHMRTLGRRALEQRVFHDWLLKSVRSQNAELKIQAALTLEKLAVSNTIDIARNLLSDNDPSVRRFALLWVGRAGMQDLYVEVLMMLHEGLITPPLFDTYLATLRHLHPEFQAAYNSRAFPSSREIPRPLPQDFYQSLLSDSTLQDTLRAMIIPHLENPADYTSLLIASLEKNNPQLREAALFSLMYCNDDKAFRALIKFVSDSSHSDEERADAILSLTNHMIGSPGNTELLIDTITLIVESLESAVFDEGENPLPVEFMRLARIHGDQELIRHITSHARYPSAAMEDQIKLWEGQGKNYQYPQTTAQWQALLATAGNYRRGKRVFFSHQAQCSMCHSFNHIGGAIGPDLTNIGLSKSTQQILNAILHPSDEIAPEWQGWYVRTVDGTTHTGRQIDVGLNSIELMTLDGTFKRYSNIEEYGIMPLSLMPEGLHYQLTKTDIRDLLTFLTSQPDL